MGAVSEANDLARAGVAHLIVENLEAPDFSAEDEHHLLGVRRLRDGEQITVGDGRGSWRIGKVKRSGGGKQSRRLVVDFVSEILHQARLQPTISIGFVVPSMDRATWAVQKMTELGVDRICFVNSKFASARLEGLSVGGKEFGKLGKVVREAAMQSRAAYVPELVPITEIAHFAKLHPTCGMCTVGGEDRPQLGFPAIVGPEGGFSQEEENLFQVKLGLGRQILRSETAAVCVASVLSMQRR